VEKHQRILWYKYAAKVHVGDFELIFTIQWLHAVKTNPDIDIFVRL